MSNNKQPHQVQSTESSQSHGNGSGPLRKSIVAKHLSSNVNNDHLINDDNMSIHSDPGIARQRKKSSGISLLKQKISNAAHKAHYHNSLQSGKTLTTDQHNNVAMHRHTTEPVVNLKKGDSLAANKSLSTVFSAQGSALGPQNTTGSDVNSSATQGSHSIYSQPIQRTFSTPSFFPHKMKKNSKENDSKREEDLATVFSNDLILEFNDRSFSDVHVDSDPLSKSTNSGSNKNSLSTNTNSTDIITGLDKLNEFNKNISKEADISDNPIFSGDDFNYSSEFNKNGFTLDDDIRQPSNLDIPETEYDSENAWKAPESWDIFKESHKNEISSPASFDDYVKDKPDENNEVYKGNNLAVPNLNSLISSASGAKNLASSKDSKKNSLSSATSGSMSPLTEAANMRTDITRGSITSSKNGTIVEERDASYDSDNDDIILTKDIPMRNQSLSSNVENSLTSNGKDLSITNFNNNSDGHVELVHTATSDNKFKINGFKTHFNSVGSIATTGINNFETRGTVSADIKERPSIGKTPFVDDNTSNQSLTDSSMQSYELYYNDFSTFDMKRKYVIKIFNLETNTFTTLSCVLNTTVEDMLPLLKKKFNYLSTGIFQMSLRIGKLSKVLHSKSKPISIQLRLLLLSGYRKNHDPLNILGIEDLSFVFQFLFHPVLTSQLSREKEELILKRGDFVHADLRDMDLSRPPIIFYQKAAEIESLDLSSNANSFLPLDFIETAISLTSIRMVNLRASKFPQNITSVATLISLELSRNFIKNIPTSISKLTNLTILNLQCNKLSELPESFSSLQHLQLLDLSSNLFDVYPEVINNCLNLLQVDFSSNRIEKLPASINKLTKLAKLNLSYNNLKVIPNLSNMTNLRTINLKDNQINCFNASSKSLQYVFLNDNKISSFEDELPNLRTLELEKNPLTSVYFKESFMNNLTTLTLSKANLTIVPSIIWKKFIQLKKLNLNENNLTQISEAIGNLKHLTFLSCNRNKLNKIPKNIIILKNLQVLDLHSNNITEIISGFVELELTTLNLSSNALNPWQNNLIEELSDQSPLSKSLTNLSLADNRLNNESCVWLKRLSNLKFLNLSYNFFTELQLAFAEDLLELYLSGNLLSSIPGDYISCMRKLRVLMINSNKINTLPAELSLLKELSVLDCSNNLLKYNIGNYLYDYNWLQNKELRYLNFSGNKRFEIADTIINNVNYADLTKLDRLLVLSLMDVTLKTSKIPDEDFNLRMRTTESKVNNMAYGVADSLGGRLFVNYRDNTVQRFRGKIDESLLILTDGKNEISNTSNKLPKILRDLYPDILIRMLEKYGDDSEKGIKNALRHSFLQLNKELNSKVHDNNNNNNNNGHKGSTGFAHSASAVGSDVKLSVVDLSSGATLTVVYVKNKVVYTANIGDTMAVLSRSTGDHMVLTKKHSPSNSQEYVRIRIAGGYVNNGKVDGVSDVSRSVGFFHLLPHIHASPDIKVLHLTNTAEMLIIATNNLWNYIDYETASDIARANKQQPMNAAAQLRDLAIAYGCMDSICVLCMSLEAAVDSREDFTGQFNINREALLNVRRGNNVFEDTALRRLEPEISAPTGNISIVFTDIKNSTALWESFPDAMRSAIKTHNSVMRRNLRLFGGYEVKTEGDAFMVAFPSPLAALNWCLTVQLKLLEATWPEEITTCPDGCLVRDEDNSILFLGLSVRMGIHWGKPVPEMDVVTQRMDYLGPVVNKAARVSSVADGGQIALSMDFVTEFKAILDMSKRHNEKQGTLKDIYGDEFVGEVLEKQLQALFDIGYFLYDLGETKMKGLETKEFITLVYPEKIKGRLSLIQSASDDLLKSRETLFFLRNISLKLEDLVSYYNCDTSMFFDEKQTGKLFNFTTDTRAAIFNTGDEKDMIKFFIHLICRIECIIATLNIRQKMYGRLEKLDESLSIFEILDMVTGIVNDPNRNLPRLNSNRH